MQLMRQALYLKATTAGLTALLYNCHPQYLQIEYNFEKDKSFAETVIELGFSTLRVDTLPLDHCSRLTKHRQLSQNDSLIKCNQKEQIL